MIKKSFEELLQECANYIQELYPNLDFRPGSVLNVALTPVCKTMETLYENLEIMMNNSYIDTVQGKYLDLKVEERGLTRNPATSSFVIVQFPKSILNWNLLWKCDSGWYFTVSSLYQIQNTLYYYVLQSQETGIATNGITEKENFVSEESYQNGNVGTFVQYLSKGVEEENDEDLKIRYLQTFQTRAQGGNIQEYKEVVNAYPGVGNSKILPATEGRAGMVTIYIVDETYGPASLTLLKNLKEYLDPLEHTGEGYGRAPIGHQVQVLTVQPVPLQVSMTVLGKSPSKTENEIQTLCEQSIQDYFFNLRKTWGKQKVITIYYYNMITSLLENSELGPYVQGFVNVRMKKEGETEVSEVLILSENEIPELGNVVITYA